MLTFLSPVNGQSVRNTNILWTSSITLNQAVTWWPQLSGPKQPRGQSKYNTRRVLLSLTFPIECMSDNRRWIPTGHLTDTIFPSIYSQRRSQWPRVLRHRSASARVLGTWVRIPPEAWMFVCCDCCVLPGRGPCDELATRPEEFYRLWCVLMCNLETSWMRSHTQSVVTGLNRRCITGCISYMPSTVTVKHDCWMSSDRLQCSGRYKKILFTAIIKL